MTVTRKMNMPTTAAELDRIFGQISRAVAEGRTDGKVIDSNGNICGEWKI